MTFEQLAGLIKAGYTEEQIRNIGTIMGTGTNTNTNTPTPTPTPTTTPTDTPINTNIQPQSVENVPETSTNAAGSVSGSTSTVTDKSEQSETLTLLKEMLGLIQRGNINTMGTGTMQEQTGADVLAEILNPSPKTK